MNWIHDAAVRFKNGTGLKPSLRVKSTRLTVRGFGVSKREPVSAGVLVGSVLKPKRVAAAPAIGSSRSFQLPSGVRATRTHAGIFPALLKKPVPSLAS